MKNLLYSLYTLLYSKDNSVLHIIKRNGISQTLKGHQYLLVSIPESFTGIQEYITQKSELDNLFSNLKKNGVKAF